MRWRITLSLIRPTIAWAAPRRAGGFRDVRGAGKRRRQPCCARARRETSAPSGISVAAFARRHPSSSSWNTCWSVTRTPLKSASVSRFSPPTSPPARSAPVEGRAVEVGLEKIAVGEVGVGQVGTGEVGLTKPAAGRGCSPAISSRPGRPNPSCNGGSSRGSRFACGSAPG